MYAIAFDLIISELKKHYKDPYHNAYTEVKRTLKKMISIGYKEVPMQLREI